ncbi:vitellogenin-1-like [Ruditapes philippinarum]|uniref:vitellogenin-1-like n=1 Tax=Ruditapes philippinarum TaxID=129788 RepID=UPI00295A97EA|nr:vitellogenin-1-like [Ruditapes philippinarum]
MYKFLVLATGILLAYCQESPRIIETSYTERKEYIYEYDSQVLSGLPEGAKTYSGLKLKTQVLIQVVSLWKVKLQVSYISFLILYVRGHVEDLTTEDEDPEWSVNIKRGVLSLLEMNFNERQSLTKGVPVLLSDSSPKVYKVIEVTKVVGECEQDRNSLREVPEDVPSMRVQKLRDYRRCLEKVVFSQDILNSQPCDRNVEVLIPFFLILTAVSESQYSFTPYSPEAGSLSTISK